MPNTSSTKPPRSGKRPGANCGNMLWCDLSLSLPQCAGTLQVGDRRAEGINYAPFGIAAIKALILLKSTLLGHAARLGQGYSDRRIAHAIALISLLYFLLLFVLTVVKEDGLALAHGKTTEATFNELWRGKCWQIIATSLVMLLVLVPNLMFREINEATDGRLGSFLLRARGRV